jgi:hypothetical protein
VELGDSRPSSRPSGRHVQVYCDGFEGSGGPTHSAPRSMRFVRKGSTEAVLARIRWQIREGCVYLQKAIHARHSRYRRPIDGAMVGKATSNCSHRPTAWWRRSSRVSESPPMRLVPKSGETQKALAPAYARDDRPFWWQRSADGDLSIRGAAAVNAPTANWRARHSARL